MHAFVFVCFFISGFASLVFEIVWDRSMATVFGGTSLALATLLTAFMFGLAAGAYVGGRLCTTIKNPLRAYGLIEIAIGLFALCVPTVISWLPTVYKPWFELTGDIPFLFHLGQFFVAFVVLAIPTTLMGSTLPLLSQFVSESGTNFRSKIGALYAINTVGACSGCFLAGFVLLPSFGLSMTNVTFATVDIVLGVVVILVSSKSAKRVGQVVERITIPFSPIFVAVCVSGFVSMALQALWTRSYLIVLGSSTYSFSLVLTSFLLGLGTGSAFGAANVRRGVSPLIWLAWSQLGLAFAACLATGFIDYLPTLLFERNREAIGSANEIYLFQFGLVALLVFVPLFLQGMMFPLVVAHLTKEKTAAGKVSSLTYGWNTVGAIVGSFATGFVILPAFGLQSSFRLVLATSVLISVVYFYLASPNKKTWSIAVPSFVLVVVTLFFATTIDRGELTRGMFRTVWARELYDPKKFLKDRPELLFAEDGSNATITVEKRGKLVTLKSNGKPEASSGADMATQILVAQMPMLVRAESQPRGGERVAMIGYGSGVTAGAALQWPLEKLVVAEIETEMVGASRFFEEVNHKPLDDPRTELVVNDGRNFLSLSDETWDVIVSEPSNPWIAGVSSLFTTEHFELVKSRLEPNGVFAQWVQLYEIHPDNVRDIIATFIDVFPNAIAFSSMPKGTDLILVASEAPIVISDRFGHASWEKDEVTRTELQRAGILHHSDLYGLLFWNGQELSDFAVGGVKNTDDNLRLEFNAPRDLVRYDIGREYFAKQYFSQPTYGDPRPHLSPKLGLWSLPRQTEFVRGLWRGGKREFSKQLTSELGFLKRDDPLAVELAVAHHAATLDLHEAVSQIWPDRGSRWHKVLVSAQTPDARLRVMGHLEATGIPKSGGFDGDKGLAYAYVLWSQRYYKHALKQLEVSKRDSSVNETALFYLLYGHVLEKRRRYADSEVAFSKAGEILQR